MPGWILLGLLVVLGVTVAVLGYGLVTWRKRIEASWAPVDLHLRRRSELIRDLVASVQGYVTPDHETVQAANRARVRSFPFLLVARPLRFRARECFEADAVPRGPVSVDA